MDLHASRGHFSMLAARHGLCGHHPQVHELRRLQAEALARGALVTAGLCCPSAAYSFHGRAHLHDPAPRPLSSPGSGSEAAPPAAASGPPAGWVQAGAGATNVSVSVRERPEFGGVRLVVAADAAAHGVVEPAAVAASLWGHAVDVLTQVVRIDGRALPAVRAAGGRGAAQKGSGPFVAVDSGAGSSRPRVRRGGVGAGSDTGSDDSSASDSDGSTDTN